MNNRILLITKDALCKSYLPVYGNTYWEGKTPNIDELAEKGTVFTNYYTAAPSTVMSFRSMMSGMFAHETVYANYTPLEVPSKETDFMSAADKLGYSCHIIWDSAWERMVLRYGNCFGNNTHIHSIDCLRQGVGCHYQHKEPLQESSEKSDLAIKALLDEVDMICKNNPKVMLWIHLPHVINGRTCYGGDIDLFDKIIGLLRTRFDDNIYISSDHGNMDGYKGKFCYGFDVYESAIAIPLITPRINALREIDWLVSNVDIKKIIFERSVPHRDVIYCDTAYYAQPNRKLCIIKDNFKYIYNKKNKKEELYDLKFDSSERCNLMSDQHYDVDRYLMTNTREIYFSPFWDELPQVRNEMQALKDDIWKQASLQVEIYERFISEMKKIVVSIRTRLK